MLSAAQRSGALPWLMAGLIILLALGARVYNVNWDEGTHIHPDERHLTSVTNDLDLPGTIGAYFDTNSSPFNPYNLNNAGSFVYGTLPVLLTKVTATALGRDNYDDIVLVGRHLSAIFDTATVLLVFLIGRRIYGAGAGLIGAAFFAAAPLAIQHSHFYVVDPFLTTFIAAALYFSVRAAQDGKSLDFALTGLTLGLAVACKITALLFLPVLIGVVLLRVWPAIRDGRQADWHAPLNGLIVALLLGFLAFRVAQPYAFETPGLTSFATLNQRWVDDQKQQANLLGGSAAFPPSVQWIDRTSYVYPLKVMVLWGMGPGFGLAGWLAFVYCGYRLLKRGDLRHLLPVLFVLVYFGFMGQQFSLYLRYFLPLFPVLAVLAGYGLLELYLSLKALGRRMARPALGRLGLATTGVVLLIALSAGAAYMSIYRGDFTRAEASRWMLAELPEGSVIAAEEWDESLPIYLRDVPRKEFEVFGLQLYHPDFREKLDRLIDDLDRADYVVVSSNRLMNSIPRNRVNYPVSSHYHEMLLNGDLGFRLARSFTSYPRLFGIEFADYGTQESWSSYDHPRVLIFEKAPGYSRERLEALLGNGPFAPTNFTPAQSQSGGLLLSDSDLQTQRRGGTWTDVFSDGGIVRSFPTLVWLAALQAAALAVTPLTLVLFRRLPDRGYLLSKPLGLLLLAYPVWLVVSLKLVHFDRTAILLCLIGLFVVAATVLRWRKHEVQGFVREHWRLALFCEVLFLLAFFFFRELRLENPDLWHASRGGEKPMDLAYLTAVIRSTTLPPYDPWLAGGYINYYYMGQFFTATLSKLTSIPPEVAFNLAVPTYFSLTVAAAFSVAYNLAASAGRFMRRAGAPEGAAPRWSPYAAGVLGAFLVAIAGNMDGLGQVVERLSEVSSWQARGGVPLLPSIINSVGGIWEVIVHGASLRDFDYWRSSRMMPPAISVTEFPYFSFLFADLHAHMMAIPFQILAIGLGLALVLDRPGERDLMRDLSLIALLGLTVGSLRAINSWDYPPFLMLALASVLISERRLEGGLWATAQRAGAKSLLLAGLSFVLFLPFLANYRSPVSGLESSPETTPIHQYLAHFGLFAAFIGAWLLFYLYRRTRHMSFGFIGAELDTLTARQLLQRQISAGLALSLLILVFFAALLLALDGRELVALLLIVFLGVLYLALQEVLRPRPDGGLRLFMLAMVGLGLGLSMGVDIVTLKGDIVRMNTVFKFYLHIWVVFALVASFAAWYFVVAVWRPSLRLSAPAPLRRTGYAGLSAMALLLLAVLIYPLMATPVRLRDRFVETERTLDGTRYMSEAVYRDQKGPIDLSRDLEGIHWLRDNVRGTPVIVEGRAELYRWGARFSIYTGLPAVVGWDWHQRQQRGLLSGIVEQRNQEVDNFYANPDVAEAVSFLRRYDVSYVVLGELERLYYPSSGLRKFENRLGGALEVAFRNDALTIYRVLNDGSAPAATGPR